MVESTDGSGVVRREEDAKQGEEKHVVRYILVASLGLAIIALLIAALVFTGR